jgi:hypothetical protein
VTGTGPAVAKGDRVVIDLEIYLPRGDKVYSEQQAEFVVGARLVLPAWKLACKG